MHVVPDLASHSLMAIGPLRDAGCIVSFDAEKVIMTYKGKIVLTGLYPGHLTLAV